MSDESLKGSLKDIAEDPPPELGGNLKQVIFVPQVMLVPTLAIRWSTCDDGNMYVIEPPTLQQEWVDCHGSGKSEWRDVPKVRKG